VSVSGSPTDQAGATISSTPEIKSTEGTSTMDVRNQQLIVHQQMNDRLAEARMARLAREARGADHGQEPAAQTFAVHQPSALDRIIGRVFDAAAAAGRSIHPTPPVRVTVVHH
jgi:hypothetical protein